MMRKFLCWLWLLWPGFKCNITINYESRKNPKRIDNNEPVNLQD